MERRATERFYIDLPADARRAETPGPGKEPSRVRIRDMSSAGAAFYDSGDWNEGDRIFMDIHIGPHIVGPFSYSLRAEGTVVRKDFEEHHGKSVYAVSFERGIRMCDWMEIEAKASGVNGKEHGLSAKDMGGE
jgi:hypothetical protein